MNHNIVVGISTPCGYLMQNPTNTYTYTHIYQCTYLSINRERERWFVNEYPAGEDLSTLAKEYDGQSLT